MKHDTSDFLRSIPLYQRLWNAEETANYLQITQAELFKKESKGELPRTRHLPIKGVNGKRWLAREIINWHESMESDADDEGGCNLYRHYDSDNKLLYVGISLSAIARLRQHKHRSTWFNKIAKVEIETLPDKDAAIEAERIAIKTEKPKFNRVRYKSE